MTIPVGFAQINWFFVGSDMPNGAQVTLGCNPDAALTPSQVAETAHGAFAVEVMPFLSQEVVLLQTLVKFGPDATGPSAIEGEATAGSTGTETVTPNTAILVGKTTLSGGRKNRGRMYWPGLVETQINGDGSLDSTAITNLSGAADGLYDALEAALIFPVILHGGAEEPTTIVSFDVRGLVATQRRRLRP